MHVNLKHKFTETKPIAMFTEDSGIFARFKSFFAGNEKQEDELLNDTTVLDETREEVPVVNQAPLIEPLQEEQVLPEAPSMVGELISEMEVNLRTVEVTAPKANMPVEKDLDIRFATKFIGAGGKFIYCETVNEAIETLKAIKEENGWSYVFAWENEIKDAFADNGFQKGAIGFTIENSDAAISLCEYLVADEGTIILNPKQASRRRLPCFPKTHVILTDVSHLAGAETDALERFAAGHKGELPSVIKLGHSNNGHFYDKQRLILNAEGTEDVYIILVDQIIPPSLRP